MPEVVPLINTGPQLLDTEGKLLVQFDLATTETHNRGIEVTQNPVERGADRGSHFYRKNYEVSLEVGFSDVISGTVEGLRATAQFNRVASLVERGEIVQLVTGVRTYPSMIARMINESRDPSTGAIRQFNIDFIEWIEVTRQTTEIPASQLGNKVVRSGQTEVNRGAQPVETPLPVDPNCDPEKVTVLEMRRRSCPNVRQSTIVSPFE